MTDRRTDYYTFNVLTMNNYPVALGDNLHIRAIIGGRTVLELRVNNVGDTSSLIAEIRSAAKGVNGLSRLFIRNCTRGWAIERPFRFYARLPFTDYRASSFGSVGLSSRASAPYRPGGLPRPRRHAIFPWDTH